ncbi:MAG: hypothetical protein NC192_09680, partial [Muribaculaceae bacterium]|nr:hypothetical protein [Muribaculaceae bacterium]
MKEKTLKKIIKTVVIVFILAAAGFAVFIIWCVKSYNGQAVKDFAEALEDFQNIYRYVSEN